MLILLLAACHSDSGDLLFAPGPDYATCVPSDAEVSVTRSPPMREVVASLPAALELDWAASPEGADAPSATVPAGTAELAWSVESAWRCDAHHPEYELDGRTIVAVDLVLGEMTFAFPARPDLGGTAPFSVYSYDNDSEAARTQDLLAYWTLALADDLNEASVFTEDEDGECADHSCAVSSIVELQVSGLAGGTPSWLAVGVSATLPVGDPGVTDLGSGLWEYTYGSRMTAVAGVTDLSAVWPFGYSR